MTDTDPDKMRRANLRLAWALAAIAVGILVAFVWSTANGNLS